MSKDIWRDWLVARLKRFGCVIYDYVPAKHTELVSGYLEPVMTWKEGNLWHYIQQRRIAKRKGNDTKDARTLLGQI